MPVQFESDLSAAFSEFGRLEPVQKPTKEMLDWRDKAFASGPDSEVLVEHTHSGVDIARKDIRTLKTRQWLNDEVMNVYMGLLQVKPRCVCTAAQAFQAVKLSALATIRIHTSSDKNSSCMLVLACLHACLDSVSCQSDSGVHVEPLQL